MSTLELRSQIIQKLNAIEDKATLEEVYNLVMLESEIESLHKLSEDDKIAVEAGLNDIKNGKVYSSDQANTLIQEWLKK